MKWALCTKILRFPFAWRRHWSLPIHSKSSTYILRFEIYISDECVFIFDPAHPPPFSHRISSLPPSPISSLYPDYRQENILGTCIWLEYTRKFFSKWSEKKTLNEFWSFLALFLNSSLFSRLKKCSINIYNEYYNLSFK